MKPKLIVIRGPAGAGKSTISQNVISSCRAMMERVGPVVYLEQDYFNQTICGAQTGYRNAVIDMIKQNAITSKRHGYSVLIEGVLNAKYFCNMFEELNAAFGNDNVTYYYLDVSLEETKKRHVTRAKSSSFGVERLDEWYSAASPLLNDREILVNEGDSSDQISSLILNNFVDSVN